MKYVFTDIHGAGKELEELISRIRLDDKNAEFYSGGDAFDRGLHGDIVYKLINKYNIPMVAGNHEVKMLNFLTGKRDSVPPHYLYTIELLKKVITIDALIEYLSNLPRIIKFDNDTILTHGAACLDNPYRLDDSANVYGNLCPSYMFDPNLHQLKVNPIYAKDGKDYYWWDNYKSDTLVLYGHIGTFDSMPRYRYSNSGTINSVGLDTNVAFGGNCTIYCIETKQIYQYRSGINWFEEFKRKHKK
jgi:hypothetical protein